MGRHGDGRQEGPGDGRGGLGPVCNARGGVFDTHADGAQPGQPTGSVRRAVLSDVPALARLVREPASTLLVGDHLSPDRRAVVLRLVLTHMGLDAGELWVRSDAQGRLQAAAALLPPRGDRADKALLLALHLGGGAASGTGAPTPVLALADDHWFLLPTSPDPALLEHALRRIDERAACAFTVAPEPDPALAAAGFRPAGADGVLVRPAAVRRLLPVRARDEPRVLSTARNGRRPARASGRSASGGGSGSRFAAVHGTVCGGAGEAQVGP